MESRTANLDKAIADLKTSAAKAHILTAPETNTVMPWDLERIPQVETSRVPTLYQLLKLDASKELYFSAPAFLVSLGLFAWSITYGQATSQPEDGRINSMIIFGIASIVMLYRVIRSTRILLESKKAWLKFLQHLSMYGNPETLSLQLDEELRLTGEPLPSVLRTENWLIIPTHLQAYKLAPLSALRSLELAYNGSSEVVTARFAGDVWIEVDHDTAVSLARKYPDLRMSEFARTALTDR